jgi:hypothetical protein
LNGSPAARAAGQVLDTQFHMSGNPTHQEVAAKIERIAVHLIDH